MTGLDRVTEEVVRTGDTSWLEEFFHPYSLKKENYAYCLHVDRGGRRELVRGFLFSDPPPARLGMIDGFSEHLARVRPEGFWDWVFALDTYNYLAPGVFRFRTEKPEPELGPGISAAIESILSGSRGFIVWHFQLEHLVGLFDARAEHCRAVRRDFNAKRPSAEAWMSRRIIEDGVSLHDLVASRTMPGGTVVPSLEEARMLQQAYVRSR